MQLLIASELRGNILLDISRRLMDPGAGAYLQSLQGEHGPRSPVGHYRVLNPYVQSPAHGYNVERMPARPSRTALLPL